MRRAQATASIDAPAEIVWAVMLDLGSYDQWNPFIVRIDGVADRAPRVGDNITLHVPGFGSGIVREHITSLRPPAETESIITANFEYEMRGPLHQANLVRARRSQSLRQRRGEPTVYRTEEIFRGLLAVAVPLERVRAGFAAHARALTERAQALAN
jgi:hypothetical protein